MSLHGAPYYACIGGCKGRSGVGACTVLSATTAVTLATVRSASKDRSMEAEVDASWGFARGNSHNSRSRRTRGDSSDMPQDGSVLGGSNVSFAPRVRTAVAASVETATCAGTKEPFGCAIWVECIDIV